MMKLLNLMTAGLWLPLALMLLAQSDSCHGGRAKPAPADTSRNASSTAAARPQHSPAREAPTGMENSPEAARRHLAAGHWGGPHVRLDVTEAGASFEFDCAHGAVGRPIELDADGGFDVSGTYAEESGGPSHDVSVAEEPGDPSATSGAVAAGGAARYVGRLADETLSLVVKLAGGRQVGQFSLKRGAAPRLFKCLK